MGAARAPKNVFLPLVRSLCPLAVWLPMPYIEIRAQWIFISDPVHKK